jgi:colanic acid/amylovoran biosynthesis glycosyltransferase
MVIWNSKTRRCMNLVISEALATGLPVVATDHSGLPDQVIDGYNGGIVTESDVEQLAEKILWLMNHPEMWEEFGRNAREHVLERYSSGSLIPIQIEHYRRLANV